MKLVVSIVSVFEIFYFKVPRSKNFVEKGKKSDSVATISLIESAEIIISFY